MSYKYYKVYYDDNFKDASYIRRDYGNFPYLIWRGYRGRVLEIFSYEKSMFVRTGWGNILHIVNSAEWYSSHEKITKKETYKLISAINMAKELKK